MILNTRMGFTSSIGLLLPVVWLIIGTCTTTLRPRNVVTGFSFSTTSMTHASRYTHHIRGHIITLHQSSSAPSTSTTDIPVTNIYEDDEQPHVKQLRSSMMFFSRYVLAYRARATNNATTSKRKQRHRRKQKKNALFHSKKLKKDRSIEIVPIPVDADGIDTDESENIGFRRTISELKSYIGEMIQLVNYDSSILVSSLTFLTLGALMESIIPHYYGQCLHCVTDSSSKIALMNSMVGLAVASTLAALFTGMRGSLFWMAGSRANYSVRVKLHRNLLRQETSFFDENETGVLISRLNSDVNKIGMVISFHVNVVLRQAAQLLFGSFYLIKASPKLSTVAYTGMIFIALVSGVYGKFSNSLADKVQDLLAKGSAVAETSFSMSETIRAFDGVSIESRKYENAQSDALELEEVQAWSYGLHKFITDTLQVIMKCAVMYACWVAGVQDGMPRAKLTRYLFYVNFVSDSSKDVGDQWAKIQAALGASRSVVELLQRIPKIRDASKQTVKVPIISSSIPVIKMSDMTVTYEGVDSPALSNIDLDIQPGDRVAIVGRSGSGKSSMLRTVLRFYDPTSGSVSLDGANLKDISRRDLSNRVCVVEQEPHLFPVTMLDNVLYGIDKDSTDAITGDESYSDSYRDAALTALDLAGLSVRGENDLGLALDTRVGDGGRTLSGGQRQRVAIARALVRNPDVLLLDEPTAALDSKSESLVVGALQNAMKKSRCMLMVTHRLGVIRAVDVNKVVVLEQGRIAEIGDPETLLHSGGIYSQLASEQGIFPIEKEHVQINGYTSISAKPSS